VSGVLTEPWAWTALAALGFFHGLNPAMGWLFAVALGLHRGSRRAVFLALPPIALGHALSVGLVLAAFVLLGLAFDLTLLRRGAGLLLIGWAAWHFFYGHRGRVRVGMQTGLAGLALWSFLASGAHGAGLTLIPIVTPLCAAASPTGDVTAASATPIALAALAIHTAAMLAAIGAVAFVVYEWAGVAFLRRGWVNVDLIWAAVLAACGAFLLVI
jgi:hypothetical protein